MSRRARYALALFVLSIANSLVASGATLYDESISGDLPANAASPTARTLSPGINSLLGSSGSSEIDYLTINVPAGMSLNNIVLSNYVGGDGASFFAIQSGPAWTAGQTTSLMLGWTHVGTRSPAPSAFLYSASNHPDYLLAMKTLAPGNGAIGFSIPLPAGSYTIWTQQAGSSPVTYQFDFIATPEPTTCTLAAIGAMSLLLVRRARAQVA